MIRAASELGMVRAETVLQVEYHPGAATRKQYDRIAATKEAEFVHR